MNPRMQLKNARPLFLLSVLFGYFALFAIAYAVTPPPDGGYANFTTAEGTKALQNLTSGVANTAVGWFSLFTNSSGSYNTAVGAGTLLANTADKNTATGVGALLSNTTGDENTANGALALLNTTTGFANSAFGLAALYNNQTGIGNTAIGESAGGHITGSDNVCIGAEVQGVDGENNTIRIADNLPTDAGQSQCFIGGILSHFTPTASNNPIVTIDPATQQLGWTMDFAANKVAEQQKKIEEQEASISQLKSEMQIMVAQLKEQAAQIQKVGDQLELNKAAPQTVLNNQ